MAKYDWERLRAEYIYGYVDEQGQKIFPSITNLSERHNIPRGTIGSRASKEKWEQEKRAKSDRIKQKVDEKKTEFEAESIVLSDDKFQNTGEKLRRSIDLKINCVLLDLKEGEYVKPYDLKMLGDALSSAQAVVKNAQGEILERSEVNVAGGLSGFNEAIKNSRQKVKETDTER